MLSQYVIDTTLLFACIFAILHVTFSLRVGIYRGMNKISMGDCGDKELLNRVRGHGNFVENAPLFFHYAI